MKKGFIIQSKKILATDRSSFDVFKDMAKYLPASGEGETMATQAWTAISKLVYRYYNGGDLPDNYSNIHLKNEYGNDVSTYANWLDNNIIPTFYTSYINLQSEQAYENLLLTVARYVADNIKSGKLDKPMVDSIYTASGPFIFKEEQEDYEDDYEDYEDYDAFSDEEEMI